MKLTTFCNEIATGPRPAFSRLPDVQKIEEGAVISVRGVPHRIVHSGQKRGVISIGMEEDGPVIRVHGNKDFVTRRVADWLKRQAKQDLTKAVDHYSEALGVKAKSITLRDTTSRWGRVLQPCLEFFLAHHFGPRLRCWSIWQRMRSLTCAK